MRSGGDGPAIKKSYANARRLLCREGFATPKTPRTSACSKDLYKIMLSVWKKLKKKTWQERFVLAAPFLAKKIEAMCKKYAYNRVPRARMRYRRHVRLMMEKERKQRRFGHYSSCMITAAKGQVATLKTMFARAGGMTSVSPYIVLKRDDGTKVNYTFTSAFLYLSAPRCSGAKRINSTSLFPRCRSHRRVGMGAIVEDWGNSWDPYKW